MHLERAYCVWSILWLYNAQCMLHGFMQCARANIALASQKTILKYSTFWSHLLFRRMQGIQEWA